jgi:transposase
MLPDDYKLATRPKHTNTLKRFKHDILQSVQKRREQVLKLHRKGNSCTEIAKNLKVCVETIRKDMRALGLPAQHSPCKMTRNQKIIEYRREGMGMYDIAKRFRISKNRVSQIILKYNKKAKDTVPSMVCKRQKPNKWIVGTKENKELWDKILEWHQAGLTRKQIANKLSVSYNYFSLKVKEFCEFYGGSITLRRYADSYTNEIVALRDSHMTICEISERLQLSPTTVCRILAKFKKS